MNFTAIDFEKLNDQQSSVCEVAMVKYRDGQEIDTFHSLIYPIGGIHRNIGGHKLKHISDADLEQAPTFANLFSAMQAFIGNDLLVCHQVGADINYIYYCEKAIGCNNLYSNGYADTKAIAQSFLGKAALTECLEAIHAPILASDHMALPDARNCATLFQYLSTHYNIEKFIHSETYIPEKERPKSGKFTNKPTQDLPFSDDIIDNYSFTGKSVVISGDFTERPFVEKKILELGASRKSGITSKTDAFIVTDNAGPKKIDQAKAQHNARPNTFHIFSACAFVNKYK